jgi:hypothetical protein
MTASNRYAMAGRIGAHVRWGNLDEAARAAATEAARQASRDRFLREVEEEFPGIDHDSAVKMAESRRKAFYSRMAMKSVAARARKRGKAGA